ncbi:MAG: 2-succinyl-5-enolpyruvyl-6-hydroxy-3-cyclohexene-1-carboxylic-acid synthase, partial [Cyanobacteria bacterium P01_A01_bin.135]
IFELLPIAQFDPPFTEFFVTPQRVDLALLCRTYGATYQRIESWEALGEAVAVLPETGVRLLEVGCDRRGSARWRQGVFEV